MVSGQRPALAARVVADEVMPTAAVGENLSYDSTQVPSTTANRALSLASLTGEHWLALTQPVTPLSAAIPLTLSARQTPDLPQIEYLEQLLKPSLGQGFLFRGGFSVLNRLALGDTESDEATESSAEAPGEDANGDEEVAVGLNPNFTDLSEWAESTEALGIWSAIATVQVQPEADLDADIEDVDDWVTLSQDSDSENKVVPQPILFSEESCSAVGLDLPRLGDGPQFHVSLKTGLVAQFNNREAADSLAVQLRRNLEEAQAQPTQIYPVLIDGNPAAVVDDKPVFVLEDAQLSSQSRTQRKVLAISWANHLRVALGADPLNITLSQDEQPDLIDTPERIAGEASWYGPYFHGRKTANGEIFDENELTAAHQYLPFNTYLRVRNKLNDRTVIVRINDRGPYIGDRSLDLSRRAAQCLDAESTGIIPYEATFLDPVSFDRDL
jgi:hypothetical protein